MNEDLRQLLILLNSNTKDDKVLAINIIRTGVIKYDDIKDVIHHYLERFVNLPNTDEDDILLRDAVLEMIKAHSTDIVKERKEFL